MNSFLAPKIYENQIFRERYLATGEHERVFDTSQTSSHVDVYESITELKAALGHKRAAMIDIPETASTISYYGKAPENSAMEDLKDRNAEKLDLHANVCRKLITFRNKLDTSESQFRDFPQNSKSTLRFRDTRS